MGATYTFTHLLECVDHSMGMGVTLRIASLLHCERGWKLQVSTREL